MSKSKCGASGLSCLIAIDKPTGMSSHDVVNICRGIFGERRIGHTGTLDPMASGVLLLCLGPATRLDAYLSGHDKRYRMEVCFGSATDTDDACGKVVRQASIPKELADEGFAHRVVEGLVGRATQTPPAYSAVKVEGQKSYKAARAGRPIHLEPRTFEVFDAQLLEVFSGYDRQEDYFVRWLVDMSVSSGTYMRSIARDLGNQLTTAAHVSYLRRLQAGPVCIEDCLSLDQLKKSSSVACLALVDPLVVLGLRYAFVQGEAAQRAVEHGAALHKDELLLNEPLRAQINNRSVSSRAAIVPYRIAPRAGEVVALMLSNSLKALYEYQESQLRYIPRCVFSVGVERGRTV